MVLFYVCNGFFHQIRLGSYQLALPVPGILKLCNYLQNVVAITYIFGLQLSTFLFYNKHFDGIGYSLLLPGEKFPKTGIHACVLLFGYKKTPEILDFPGFLNLFDCKCATNYSLC